MLLEISKSLDMKASQFEEKEKILYARVSTVHSYVLGVSDRQEENCWPPIITHWREEEKGGMME